MFFWFFLSCNRNSATATLRQLLGNASAFRPRSLGRRWVERCELVRESGAEFVGELVRELVREFVGEFVGMLLLTQVF